MNGRTQCPCIETSATALAEGPGEDAPNIASEGFVDAVETCGAVDGPGLRYVVFTKGCPLRCQYCHNPETQGPPRGTRTSAAKVLADVLRYKSFLRRGGLTISGGEPLMQPTFVHALARGAKQASLHTALDTSGCLGRRASDALIRDLDLVILDIKSGTPETHRIVTGADLAPTLEFARRVDALGTLLWIRFVLVPGLTDAPENIARIARFVGTLRSVARVELLPFHKLGEHKYERAKLPYKLKDTPAPGPKDMAKARAIFAAQGIEVFPKEADSLLGSRP